MQILKVYPPRRREKYGNRFLMSLKLPAGRGIYHKSSRSPWNNLKNESPTWSTNIVKSGQEWTVLEKKALRKLWEPSNFFTLWIKSSDRGMGLICFNDYRLNWKRQVKLTWVTRLNQKYNQMEALPLQSRECHLLHGDIFPGESW